MPFLCAKALGTCVPTDGPVGVIGVALGGCRYSQTGKQDDTKADFLSLALVRSKSTEGYKTSYDSLKACFAFYSSIMKCGFR